LYNTAVAECRTNYQHLIL